MSRTIQLCCVLAMAGLLLSMTALNVTAADKKEKKAKALAPINDKCPLSGKAVDASKVSVVKVNFCCKNCQAKFNKNPLAFLAKVKELPNGTCPVSGKATDKEVSSPVAVGFCCANCKGKFDKTPAAFLGKVKAKGAE